MIKYFNLLVFSRSFRGFFSKSKPLSSKIS